MFIQLNVFDTSDRFRGQARMRLNWQEKTWIVEEDQQWVWRRVGFSNVGSFEVKSWGVIWIWDQLRNPVIFHDAPQHSIDFKHQQGRGRIYDPKDSSFKDARVNWSINPVTASTASPKSVELSPRRVRLLQVLNQVLPCTYASAKFDKITGKLRKDSPGVGAGYTTCGSLPGFVTSELGAGHLKGDAWQKYMQKRSLNGTNAVRIKGIQHGAWVEADLVKRPLPGDIYALLNNGKSNRATDGISHVGVIMDASGDVWKTADMGQGGGWEGKINVERPYKAKEGELFGETIQGGGYRILAGWVDIDKYFG